MSDAQTDNPLATDGGDAASELESGDRPRILVSCEHGGNEVPKRYQHLFDSPGAARLLASHRGWDLAALPLAQHLAQRLSAPLHQATVSRLLIDLNRSLDNHELLSKYSMRLDPAERQRLVENYYTPYRQGVQRDVESLLASGNPVLHISVHSFTPRIRGVWRSLEIGLLFDPDRAGELRLCQRWQQQLMQRLPRMRVRLNEPYLGISDGLTTSLRSRLASSRYLGIELEVNQRLRRRCQRELDRLYAALGDSLAEICR